MEVEENTGLVPADLTPATTADLMQPTIEEAMMSLQINDQAGDAAIEEWQCPVETMAKKTLDLPIVDQDTAGLLLTNEDDATCNNASVQTEIDAAAFEVPEEEWDFEAQPVDSPEDEQYYSLEEEFSGVTMPIGVLMGQLPFPGPLDLYYQTFGPDAPTYGPGAEQLTLSRDQGGDWALPDRTSTAIPPTPDNLFTGDGGGEPCPAGRELKLPLQKPCHTIAVQTDFESRDSGINTEEIIEKNLEKMMSERTRLKESYQEVLDKQRQVESQLHVQLRQLQQRREEERKNHKEIIQGIQDVTVKREETTKKIERERKEFSLKEPELKVEGQKLLEKNKRLLKEQDDKENKVVSLVAEQSEEKELWEEELAQLKKQYSDISRHVLEETERALEAEVMSLESRKELFFLRLSEAENETKLRLTTLRSLPENPDLKNLRMKWEQRLRMILTHKETLQEKFKEHIQLVKNGAKLCTLPELSYPNLPPKPSSNIETNLMLQAGPQSPPSLQQRAQFPMAPGATMLSGQPVPLHPGAHGRSSAALAPSRCSNVPQATSDVPPPGHGSAKGLAAGAPHVDKLGKVLEKLMVRFPQYNKAELTAILQQIKSSRGTLAGLSMDDLIQMMATRLADLPEKKGGNTQPLSPIGSHLYNFPPPRMITPVFLPAAQPGYAGRSPQSPPTGNPCLMCQKIVQPRDVHPMACTHVLHRECIQFWAKTYQNDSCPFCSTSK